MRDLFAMSKQHPRIFSAVPRIDFKRAGIVLRVLTMALAQFASLSPEQIDFSYKINSKKNIEFG